jgi:hypothetical protein
MHTINIMKNNLTKYVCGIFLLVTLTTARAQSTFNYYITPAGGTHSQVTWNVTGSLTQSPGVAWEAGGQFGGVPIETAGLFISSYTGKSFPQSISVPDGSYYHNTELGQNFAINLYSATIFGSTDIFGLVTSPATTADGQHLIYTAATQSVIIPIPYSDFNAGNYQSTFAAGTFFDTSVTVNLTVGAVPEPSTLDLSAMGGLGTLLCFRRRKKS